MTLWSACPEGRFRFKEWDDDDAVAYDLLGGDTHVVDTLAMELLYLLRQRPAQSVQELVTDLREVFAEAPDDEIARRIEVGLSRLKVIGLAAADPA